MSDALSGDGRSDETGEEKQDTQEKEVVIPERAEEAKLKAKYPSLGLQKPGGSDFLMKRLQKGQKYFDSGDYNMAKAVKNKQLPTAGADKNLVTGDHIPTPQDLPQRKSSLVTSKLAGAEVLCVLSQPREAGQVKNTRTPLLEASKLSALLQRSPWPEQFHFRTICKSFPLSVHG
ncbi:alpha-endosulfine isoform X2 [Paroedura picta]|uniref:alpha-endosulfine isoform X2 n=1 Tax=Paroedura picta TaxID=143630 RepID=UPI0040562778